MKLKTSLFLSLLLLAGVMLFFTTLISANYENSGHVSCTGSGCHREVAEDEHIINVVVQPAVPNTEDDRWTAIVSVEEWNETNSEWQKTERPVGGKLVIENETDETILAIQFNNETGIKHLTLMVPEEFRVEGNYTIYAGFNHDGELVCMKQSIYFPTTSTKPVAQVYLYDEGKKAKSVSKYINQYGRAEIVIDGSESFDLDKDDEDKLTFQWVINEKVLSTTAQTFHYVFTQTGSYTINLTVTDTSGLEDEDSASVVILEKEYKADLLIEKFELAPDEAYPDDDLSVTLKIANKGNIAASEFYVKIYDTHEGVRENFKALFLADLKENTTKSYHFILQTEKVGEHFLEVRVDPGSPPSGLVEEFDETNNDAGLPFFIKEVPVPRPLIASVEFDESLSLIQDDIIVFTVNLINDATVESSELKLKLYVDKVPVETVHVGPFKGEKSVELVWTAGSPGETLIQFSLQSSSEVKDFEEYTLTVEEKEGSETSTEDEPIPLGVVPVVASFSFAALALSVFYGFKKYEGFKYAMLSAFLPMYTRIKKEDTLKHSLREELYQYIVSHPGKNYISIKSELELKNGTLIYHLKTLENQRFIKSIKDGRYRRFYPWGMKVKKDENQLSSIQKKIIEVLDENPGISQSKIGEELGQSRQTINYQIGKLRDSDIVEVERRGITSKCYLTKKWKDT